MTTYINLHGQQIEIRSADPANPTEGQIWYNTTSSALKGYQFVQGWATGGALGTGRFNLAGAGTQTAGLAFGGAPPPTTGTPATEEYDGSAWTAGGNMGRAVDARYVAGSGTQTAGLAFGGSPYSNLTEEYNGSTWSPGGNLNSGRYMLAGAGIQTAGLAIGGREYVLQNSNKTEEYDGTSWTAGGNMGTGRRQLAGCGTQTAALGFGGYAPPGNTNSPKSEEYDGTSWTTGGNLNVGRWYLAGCGTQTSALGFGGYTPYASPFGPGSTSSTEKYDGTSWTTTGSLNIAKQRLAGAGTQTAGLAFGGAPTPTGTEEYSEANATKTFTVS